MRPYNILYLHAHDAGRFIQPFGYDIPAPNLQRLANEGVLFRKAFCAAPSCSPSRAALVTGEHPHVCGMHGLATSHCGFTLNDYSHHLAQFLNDRGYETALAGVQHVARLPWADPHHIGYERLLNYDDEDKYDPKTTLAATLGFLNEEHERPFFLSVGFVEPHRYNPGDRKTFSRYYPEEPDGVDARYCLPLPIYPDLPETRRETANFKMGVRVLDREVGAILDGLIKADLKENTLVICTTDHGPGFPGMKCTLTDWGTGVFLIVRGPLGGARDRPGGFEGGKVIDGMVSHMDIYPTLCEFLGFEKPDWLQGESFLPLVRGDADEIHDEIYLEQGYHGRYLPLRAIRTTRYKLIRCFEHTKTQDHYSADSGPTHHLWVERGWDRKAMPRYQLYDLILDPAERHNVADDPDYADVFGELEKKLARWMRETDDPLLEDDLPLPPAWNERR